MTGEILEKILTKKTAIFRPFDLVKYLENTIHILFQRGDNKEILLFVGKEKSDISPCKD